jgi:hypothetical protein
VETGTRLSDEIVIFRVLTANVRAARRFFRKLKAELKRDLEQEEILIVEKDAEALSTATLSTSCISALIRLASVNLYPTLPALVGWSAGRPLRDRAHGRRERAEWQVLAGHVRFLGCFLPSGRECPVMSCFRVFFPSLNGPVQRTPSARARHARAVDCR